MLRREIFDAATVKHLVDHLQVLRGLTGDAQVAYRHDKSLVVKRDQAIAAVAESLAMSRRVNKIVARAIRKIAEGQCPAAYSGGGVNLASWLGADTLEWHFVFAYSDLDPCSRAPWFLNLTEECQRICLHLVAYALEDE